LEISATPGPIGENIVCNDATVSEIAAIPKLLELLQVKEATVTIDAIGCRKDIAHQIVEKDGHCVLALKANQARLGPQLPAQGPQDLDAVALLLPAELLDCSPSALYTL